ncbi:MAG: GatB/YqeY domain-containing protein [bacterium]|nr:GatB/YqeY domain-containing protein [bacterium]
MSLLQRIDQDVKAALKSGDTLKRQTLGMVKAALSNYRIAQRKTELDDADVISVLTKEVKSRKDSAAEYTKAGARDRADKEEQEVALLNEYLPAQMSQQEIGTVVSAALQKTGAKGLKDMGKVMGVVSKELKGRADLKAVNELVKRLLGQPGA